MTAAYLQQTDRLLSLDSLKPRTDYLSGANFTHVVQEEKLFNRCCNYIAKVHYWENMPKVEKLSKLDE